MRAERAPLERVRAWGQVAAAITLVAEGRYPEVSVSNIPDAVQVALGLRLDAERCGVDLATEIGSDGAVHSVVVRKR